MPAPAIKQGLERVGAPPCSRPHTRTSARRSTTRSASPPASHGLTPLVFIITGLIFADRRDVRRGHRPYPEAGGSASFARHAFNELVSFFAGWAQMLNYVITVAISVIFVPRTSRSSGSRCGRSVGHRRRIGLTWLLIGINIIGIQEAARLNITLAVIDFATLAAGRTGFFLIFHPHVLWTTCTGASRPRGRVPARSRSR